LPAEPFLVIEGDGLGLGLVDGLELGGGPGLRDGVGLEVGPGSAARCALIAARRIWFRSRLHGHAQSGFIPLGGNTVFIRRSLIEQVGGWDGDCLAETARSEYASPAWARRSSSPTTLR